MSAVPPAPIYGMGSIEARQMEQGGPKPPAAREWARPDEEQSPAERATRLHPSTSPGTSKVPFPIVDREAYLQMTHESGSISARTHGAPVALVNLRDLHAIQSSINDERLMQHLDSPDMVSPGTRGSGHGGLVDRPVVVRKGGVLYIHDGHHRLTAASLRGQETAKVRLVDLDGEHVPA